MRRTAIIIPVLLVSALALAGCSAGGSGSGGSTSHSGAAGGVTSQSDGAAGDSGGRAASPQKDSTKLVSPTERETIITGSVEVTVDTPIAAAARVASLAVAAGGRVDGRTEQAASGSTPASASLTIRVPQSKVDRVIADLKGLGRDAKVETHADDVTAVHQDTAARIRALQSSIARFEQFMGSATSTEDLISLESEISDRQAELESLQAQQRGLDDQISLATLTVQLTSPTAAVKPAPGDFGSGLVLGWAAFTAFLGWLSVALGVALPWIVVAGLVLAAVLGLRALRRRMRGADGAGGTGTPTGAGPGAPGTA